MDQSARVERLSQELESLKDPEFGYVRASRPRFDRLFGRDSLIVAWQRLEREPQIAVATLRLLAKLQGTKDGPEKEEEPGKILHEWAPKPVSFVRWTFPYYGSVDATPLFVLVASWTVRRLDDDVLRGELWPHVRAACAWITGRLDRDERHLLTYAPRAKQTLHHQGWKDSGDLGPSHPTAIAEVQGYAYSALLHAAEWADMLEPSLAAAWRAHAAKLKSVCNARFWVPEENTFAMAVQGDGTPYAGVSSNPGHLLFTGIVDADLIEPVIGRLFEDQLWTQYGIRTLSTKDRFFDAFAYHRGSVWPHDNWIIAEGLRVLGQNKKRDMIRDALIRADDALGKLPELYAVHFDQIEQIPRAQHPQAWATGALLNLLDSSLDPKKALPLLPPDVSRPS